MLLYTTVTREENNPCDLPTETITVIFVVFWGGILFGDTFTVIQLHDEIVSVMLIVCLDLFIRKKINSFLPSLGIFSIISLESTNSSNCLFSDKLLSFVNKKVVKIK